MSNTQESWTTAHDLALIYIALAYGTDYDLSDKELDVITSALEGWSEGSTREEVQEVVVEAMTVFLEDEPEREVVNSMQSLRDALSLEDRGRALEEIMRVAEADGVLLGTEQSLISTLAEVWEIRAAGDRLFAESAASVEQAQSWSLLHDMGLMYVVVAHSTDNDLSEVEISAMIDRLSQWQPGVSVDGVRRILREVLQFYAGSPAQEELQRSVFTIAESLPMMQRLALLDDLLHIAEADGDFKAHEQDMILNLAQAWNVNVRLNGAGTAQA